MVIIRGGNGGDGRAVYLRMNFFFTIDYKHLTRNLYC
jgi:hypothetical protein